MAQKSYKGYSISQQSSHSFRIQVSHNRKRYYKTWSIPSGMSESKALKEVERVAQAFSDEIKAGHRFHNKVTFSEYAEYFLTKKVNNDKIKNTTNSDYSYLITRLKSLIGNCMLTDITPSMINQVYLKLTDPSAKTTAVIVGKPSLNENIKKMTIQIKDMPSVCNVAQNTLDNARSGKPISKQSAEKIANGLNVNIKDIFDITEKKSSYSSKTISSIVKLLGEILEDAYKEDLIKENPFKRTTPPKHVKSSPNYLTDEEVISILEASEREPLHRRLQLELFVMTGARRGEISGLKWNRVDFINNRITIDWEVTYTAQFGLEEKPPKTPAGIRSIELPPSTMKLLSEYYDWYVNLLGLDDSWDHNDYLFFQTEKLPKIIPINPTSLTKYFRTISERYDLPHINPHALRHAYASVLIASKSLSDLDLAHALGHSSAQITKEVYGHLLKDPAAQTANIISSAYKKK